MPDNKRCFLDTNIWLYALIESEENRHKSKIAAELVKAPDVFVSVQVINEVCINLIRKVGFNETQVGALIKSFYKDYPVVEVDLTILLTASNLRQRYAFAFWDSLIVASALAAESEILYSEDMQDGMLVDGKLEITNPFLGSPLARRRP